MLSSASHLWLPSSCAALKYSGITCREIDCEMDGDACGTVTDVLPCAGASPATRRGSAGKTRARPRILASRSGKRLYGSDRAARTSLDACVELIAGVKGLGTSRRP